jgi:MFS superfamily sulfate permease-like transporter
MRGSERFSGSRGRFLWDVSGAFGDIGVLFPLAIALIAQNGFNPTALFLMASLFYIASARYFRVTMPVQPLKAMSAIAISSGVGIGVINAAGVIMGAILLIIALTGLSVRLGSLFPVSVVRGIQLGLGMMLIKASISLMGLEPEIAIASGVILLASILVLKKVPPLIPILMVGIGFSLKEIELPLTGPMPLGPALPSLDNLRIGFTLLVLPQIALTFGNAIVATEATGRLLYGGRAERLNLKNIPMSMGLANIASGLLGGAPMCHGSGGLTAHRKFGATSEMSGYIIGMSLIALALVFGGSALSVVSAFPKGILGVLLCYVGAQHCLFIKDILNDRTAVPIALSVALVGFASGNLSVGFLMGLGFHYGVKGFTYLRSRVLKGGLNV